MSEIYESDQEQVEKIKKWWDENGKTTVIGLVLGLGGMFGWTAWQSYETAQAEAASAVYSQIVRAAESGEHAKVEEQAQALIRDFPNSGYMTLATLYRAGAAMQDGRKDAGKAHLEWIVENGSLPEYQQIARLRLARIALDADAPSEAQALIDAIPADSAFQEGAVQALKGDLAAHKGDLEGARSAYEAALQVLGENTPLGIRLRLALDDLGSLNVPDA